jgi:G:T/U-mismatch repair DNA glycosylase
MFLHKHPYQPFIPKNATKLIIGTLPPPRFSQGNLLERDVDFCYGSRNGQLWPILDYIFKLDLKFETSEEAIKQRKEFLINNDIGICDIVNSCIRQKIDASDLGMQDIELRDLISYLKQHPKIDTLLFTGGNSKNGPEYFFRRHLKEYKLKLEVTSNEVPRIHQFNLENRIIKTVSLTAPSGSANRAIGSMDVYKALKQQNPNFNTFDFRVLQYKEYF